jgi:CBS domain-containing protein
MNVSEILRRKAASVITIGPGTSLGQAAGLFLEHRIGGVPVVTEEGELMGFLAEREFVSAVDQTNASIRSRPVEAFMQRPAPTCSAQDSLPDVMTRMTHQRLRHLVVMDQGEIKGVISVGDVVKFRLEELETETGVLRDYLAGQRAIR